MDSVKGNALSKKFGLLQYATNCLPVFDPRLGEREGRRPDGLAAMCQTAKHVARFEMVRRVVTISSDYDVSTTFRV